MESYIQVQGVTKNYGNGKGDVWALRGMEFGVEKGEFAAIMGESGSGKSTVLSVLGALNTPTEGRVLVDGIDIYDLSSEQRAVFRREYIGFVFQSFNLVAYLTALQNVMLPLAAARMKSKEKEKMALEALDQMGLESKAGRLPNQLSGGEQERVAMARAIVCRPPILLADEPTGNLDTRTSGQMLEILNELNAGGMTIVMVTHSERCARQAGRVVQVADGLVVNGGSRSKVAPLAANM